MDTQRSKIQSLLGINNEIEAKLKEVHNRKVNINSNRKESIEKLHTNTNKLSLSNSNKHVKMRLFLRKETRDRLHIHKINTGENISDIVDAAVTAYLNKIS
ncbi:MAG: hypothetical protein QNJ34_00140 [Xenococcaceae cyanobacterium MO_188.B29]|nr:hypothetical protein [Xenococcaceae cyanobacterium MO_188.B29]